MVQEHGLNSELNTKKKKKKKRKTKERKRWFETKKPLKQTMRVVLL
jgi:hypothetical protein